MIDQAARTQIETHLRTLERAWNELDFAAIKSIWDTSRPPVYFAEEAANPHLDWPSLEAYWDFTRRSISRMGMRITNAPELVELAPELVSVIYRMHWDALIAGDGKPLGGDNRVCATFRHTSDGWRLAQYVEAPLAPITYMKWLYEQAVTPGFATGA